ncbi:MAG TPA: protein kinase [Myxococcaceae bacterium]|nr:protein kinase [Myxococcaceae bacterium]
MSERPRLPPDLVLERMLTPERSFVVRVGSSGALGVVRRCAGRLGRLRRRLEKLAVAAPAALVVEGRLIEYDGACWAVRPWIHGRPLRDLRRQGAVPAREALRVASTLAEAAAALNARGLVHGRLHAGNVIVCPDSEVRIVDALDVAALPVPGVGEVAAEVSVAPEILRGERASPATDVYGIGLVLYELLTGAHPFAAESAYESARRALYEQPEGWEVVGAEVPRELVPILRAALAKRPALRFRRVDRFIAAFERATESASSHAIASRPPASARSPRVFVSAAAAHLRRWQVAATDTARRIRVPLPALTALRARLHVRRAVAPALAAAALLAIGAVAAGWSRTSALEQEVEGLLLARDTARAAARVLEHQKENGEDAITHKLLGDVSCARGEHARCLELYSRALQREPRFAANARLRDNVLALLDRGDLQSRLREIMVRLEDVEEPLLAGTRQESYWRRWNSVRALEARNATAKVDFGVVYGLDVVYAGSCSTRQASLAKIVQLRMGTALPYLEQARRNGGRTLFGDMCLGRDLDRAIRALRDGGPMSAGAR